MTTRHSAVSTTKAGVSAREATRHSAFLSFCAPSLKAGTSADDTMPPISKSNRSVGTIAAAWYALTSPVEPNKLAFTDSRARPKIRLATLPSAMIDAARAMASVSLAASDVIGTSLVSRRWLMPAIKEQGGRSPPTAILPHAADLPPHPLFVPRHTQSISDSGLRRFLPAVCTQAGHFTGSHTTAPTPRDAACDSDAR